jgi:hypothetical protein
MLSDAARRATIQQLSSDAEANFNDKKDLI